MQLVWVLFMFVVLHKIKYWRLCFQGKNHIMMNLFWKDNLKLMMMRVNVMKNDFPSDITVSVL